MTLRLGTRGSALALTQSRHVAVMIEAALGQDVELVTVTTLGDTHPGSLAAMPQPGVFASALREALLSGDVDVVVHSMKDLPSEQPRDLVIAAVPERADPRDALVSRDGRGLAELPRGARVGTGSPRRQARLLAARPDLAVIDIRGNVDTRIGRVHDGDLDAVVLAVAGIERLGRAHEIAEFLEPALMLPAPAQGALAVEVVADSDLAWQLAALDHVPSRLATIAERQVLTAVAATCATALGAYAVVDGMTISLAAEISGRDPGEFANYSGMAQFGPDFLPVEVAIALGAQAGQALLDAGAASFANLR